MTVRKKIRMVACWCALAAAASGMFASAQADPPTAPNAAIPAELAAARDAAKKVEAGFMNRLLDQWEKTATLPTIGDKAATHWEAGNGSEITSDAQGLHLHMQNANVVTYKDQRFDGPTGVMYSARTENHAAANDLSCVLDGSGRSVQLRFGGVENSQSYIQAYPANRGNTLQIVQYDPPLIVPDQWHKVVLLMAENHVYGFVDGAPVGESLLSDPVTARNGFRLQLVVSATKAIYKDIVILRPKENPPPVPGEDNDPAVHKNIGIAVKYIGDPNYAIRQAAAETLWGMRPMSTPALQSLATSKDPEIHSRAAEMLDRMQGALSPKTTQPVTRRGNRANARLQQAPMEVGTLLVP